MSVNAAKHPYAPAPETARCRGCDFTRLCRGKISEGINFADANARAVICVGIPYPNIKDPLVAEKRSYNDAGRHRGLMSEVPSGTTSKRGGATNQCVGRMLRHRYDHGAIMLVDQRFTQQHLQSLPKWLRPAMQRAPARLTLRSGESAEVFRTPRREPAEEGRTGELHGEFKGWQAPKNVNHGGIASKIDEKHADHEFFRKATSSNASTGDPAARHRQTERRSHVSSRRCIQGANARRRRLFRRLGRERTHRCASSKAARYHG